MPISHVLPFQGQHLDNMHSLLYTQGVKELAKQVKSLPVVNYNLLKYICR